MKRVLALGLMVVSLSAVSSAQFFASSDLSSYALTMTKYASLADAQNQTGAIQSYTLTDGATNDRRDAAMYFVDDVATFNSTDHAVFLTAWYYTTEDNTDSTPKDDPGGDRYFSGWGNPNNTNTGFLQMYDVGATTTSSMTGAWSTLDVGVTDGSTFQVNASGTNAGSGQFARLWHGATGGAGSLTAGVFHTWALDYTATGLTANWNATHGLYASSDHASSVSGSFTGIFENTNSTDTQYNGFYTFEASLNADSWAFDQGDAALNGDFATSQFGAVPEPGTMAVLGLGALAAWRKKAKKA